MSELEQAPADDSSAALDQITEAFSGALTRTSPNLSMYRVHRDRLVFVRPLTPDEYREWRSKGDR